MEYYNRGWYVTRNVCAVSFLFFFFVVLNFSLPFLCVFRRRVYRDRVIYMGHQRIVDPHGMNWETEKLQHGIIA